MMPAKDLKDACGVDGYWIKLEDALLPESLATSIDTPTKAATVTLLYFHGETSETSVCIPGLNINQVQWHAHGLAVWLHHNPPPAICA